MSSPSKSVIRRNWNNDSASKPGESESIPSNIRRFRSFITCILQLPGESILTTSRRVYEPFKRLAFRFHYHHIHLTTSRRVYPFKRSAFGGSINPSHACNNFQVCLTGSSTIPMIIHMHLTTSRQVYAFLKLTLKLTRLTFERLSMTDLHASLTLQLKVYLLQPFGHRFTKSDRRIDQSNANAFIIAFPIRHLHAADTDQALTPEGILTFHHEAIRIEYAGHVQLWQSVFNAKCLGDTNASLE
ncbi:hypothetical protein FPV67DRAFT_1448942 [Lyophyllum atratum]|nr:hypothetical protein FPV67DRAFT_1448942 [Lyophyllum atratum]